MWNRAGTHYILFTIIVLSAFGSADVAFRSIASAFAAKKG